MMIQSELLLDWLGQHPFWLAASVAFIAFLESLAVIGILVPGVVILFALAALAGSLGTPDLSLLLFSGFLGALAGDSVSFYIGWRFQHRIAHWPYLRHRPEWLAQGRSFIENHGGKSLILGRFVGPLRPIIPLLAGSLALAPWRFISINILTAALWSPFYLLPGYSVGTALEYLPTGWQVLVISTLVLALLSSLLFRFYQKPYLYGLIWLGLMGLSFFPVFWQAINSGIDQLHDLYGSLPRGFPSETLVFLLVCAYWILGFSCGQRQRPILMMMAFIGFQIYLLFSNLNEEGQRIGDQFFLLVATLSSLVGLRLQGLKKYQQGIDFFGCALAMMLLVFTPTDFQTSFRIFLLAIFIIILTSTYPNTKTYHQGH